MNKHPKRTILLALGNDILGDDGIGLAAARILKTEFGHEIEVVESPGGGLALLDILEGYDRALLLDGILTGKFSPGTVLEFTTADFQKVVAPSPHYAGLPEVLAMAVALEIDFPEEIKILALEVEEPYVVREGFTQSVEEALPTFVESARRVLMSWRNQN